MGHGGQAARHLFPRLKAKGQAAHCNGHLPEYP